MYLILSQTGLRISEVLSLEVEALDSIKIFNGEEAHYLKYKTWKSEDGNNSYRIIKIYVNELTKKGYSTLFKLHESKRNELKLPYLYMGGPLMKKTKSISS